MLLDALERTHATFAGFHAYIGDYLKDHAYLAEYIANRLGYWYFLDSVTYEDTPDADTAMRLTMTFETRGFGRCYRPYTLRVKLTPKAGGTPLLHTVEGFDNRPWERGTRYDVHTLVPLDGLRSGVYEVAVGMSEVLRDGHHPIELALSTGVCDADGFYTVGIVQIQEETL